MDSKAVLGAKTLVGACTADSVDKIFGVAWIGNDRGRQIVCSVVAHFDPIITIGQKRTIVAWVGQSTVSIHHPFGHTAREIALAPAPVSARPRPNPYKSALIRYLREI